MATVNLYVSDALKEQMNEHADLNWSRVASDAFQTAIDLERTREMSIDEAKLERLRILRESAGDRRRAEAVALGKQWAMDVNDYEAVDRVANMGELPVIEGENPHWKALAAAIVGSDDLGYKEVNWALQPIFGSKNPTLTQADGFVAGVTEVFLKL